MSAAEEDQVVEEVFSLAVSRDNAEDTAAQAETAAKYKEEGNQHFRNQQFEDAERSYSRAIQTCPAEFVEDLAVYLGNRAACYASMGEHALVIDDCSAALEKKPDYGKVLVRRSQAFEKLDKIDEALADAKQAYALDPAAFPKLPATIARLEKLSEERMEKLKTEALGKLKDLGNSILGNFGMSLDNFKMQQGPEGGWNISMNNK